MRMMGLMCSVEWPHMEIMLSNTLMLKCNETPKRISICKLREFKDFHHSKSEIENVWCCGNKKDE